MADKTLSDEEIARVMKHVGGASAKSAVWPKVTAMGSLFKYIWSGTVVVFMAGVTIAVASNQVVRAKDFDPVQKSVSFQNEHLLPGLEKRITSLELTSVTTASGVGDLRAQLGSIASTLQGIDRAQRAVGRRTITAALCSMYRDNYVADLADYATKIRKKPPVKSPSYVRCMTALQSQLHEGG